MKEYSYATSNKSYATGYLTNNRGIMYEIEVPKNSRVSRTGNETCDEIVFPRSSQFECIGTERIKDADKDYLHVKLRYIQPKEPWRTSQDIKFGYNLTDKIEKGNIGIIWVPFNFKPLPQV